MVKERLAIAGDRTSPGRRHLCLVGRSVEGELLCLLPNLPIPVNLNPNSGPFNYHRHRPRHRSAAGAQPNPRDRVVRTHLLPHRPPSAGLRRRAAPTPQPARRADRLAGVILRRRGGGDISPSNVRCVRGVQLVNAHSDGSVELLYKPFTREHTRPHVSKEMSPTCFRHCKASSGFRTSPQR